MVKTLASNWGKSLVTGSDEENEDNNSSNVSEPQPLNVCKDVSFDITESQVRVKVRDDSRTLHFSDIESIAIIPIKNSTDLGHVVFRQKGHRQQKPPIPQIKKLKRNQLQKSLNDGSLTFWHVSKPLSVAKHVQKAAEKAWYCISIEK